MYRRPRPNLKDSSADKNMVMNDIGTFVFIVLSMGMTALAGWPRSQRARLFISTEIKSKVDKLVWRTRGDINADNIDP